jgi:hypothetical protein
MEGNLENVDPLFMDTKQMDLRLRDRSPARGRGVSVPLLDDFGGSRRRASSGRDVGAFHGR